MKIWLDDVRIPPQGEDWVWVTNGEDFLNILCWCKGLVLEASLDHDLGGGMSGYDVVCSMEQDDNWPIKACYVHSMNPVGAPKMQQVIDKHYKG